MGLEKILSAKLSGEDPLQVNFSLLWALCRSKLSNSLQVFVCQSHCRYLNDLWAWNSNLVPNGTYCFNYFVLRWALFNGLLLQDASKLRWRSELHYAQRSTVVPNCIRWNRILDVYQLLNLWQLRQTNIIHWRSCCFWTYCYRISHHFQAWMAFPFPLCNHDLLSSDGFNGLWDLSSFRLGQNFHER